MPTFASNKNVNVAFPFTFLLNNDFELYASIFFSNQMQDFAYSFIIYIEQL